MYLQQLASENGSHEKKVDKRQGAANSKNAELAFLTNMTSKEQIGTEQQKIVLDIYFWSFLPG